jgi:uncharacterized protein (TIGR02118 family)
MVKMVILFKRRPGMTVEAFQAHWRTTHANLIVRLPGIRRYCQSHVLPSSYREGEPAADGVAESSFDDTQAMKALAGSPQYADVLADERNFIDGSTLRAVITEETVIKDAPAPAHAVKRIDFVSCRPGTPIDEFRAYWRDVHGPACAAIPAVRRFVQNLARRAIYDSGRTPAFDGVDLAWFESVAAADDASPAFARRLADAERFVAGERSGFVLARGHAVIA